MKKVTLSALAFATVISFTLTSCGNAAKKDATVTETSPATAETSSATADTTTAETTTEATVDMDLSAGEKVYTTICLACHQATGEGIPGAFPPLAGSDYLAADKTRAIKQVLNGSEGEIVVNGTTFNGVMPPQKDALKDQQIADVLNYVSHTWKNNGDTFTPEDIAAAR